MAKILSLREFAEGTAFGKSSILTLLGGVDSVFRGQMVYDERRKGQTAETTVVALDFNKVMLVDGDGDVSGQCERVLKRCGASEVVLVRSLKSAGRRLATKERVDFLLIDVDLDEVVGDSIANLLYGSGGSSHDSIPVLFIANVRSRADVRTLQEVGCYSFVMKPLNDTILESKIRQAAEKSFDSEKQLQIIVEIGAALEQRRLDDAEKILRPFLRKYPTNSTFQILLAELFFLRGDAKTARVIVEKTLKSDSAFQAALSLQKRLVSHAHAEKKRAAEAASKAKLAVVQAELDAHHERALSFSRGGQFEQSIALFETLLAKTPDKEVRSRLLLEMSRVYLDWKNLEKSSQTLEECAKNCPPDWPELIAARWALKEIEATMAADIAAKEAETIVPGGSEILAFAPPAGATSDDLDPEDEQRILRFIMFEGKY
jgi:tetratricopeptide (TPR) repeat protein